LKIQAWILTFLSFWLLATQIPVTLFVATRDGGIDAFLDGQQLPAQVVQATLAAQGASTKYSKIHPRALHRVIRLWNFGANLFFSVVLLAIFPWIALLFATFLIAVLFAAARRHTQLETTSKPPISDGEKADYQA
jgi:hypothetical protein